MNRFHLFIICLSGSVFILGMHDISIWDFLFVFPDISIYASSDERNRYILYTKDVWYMHVHNCIHTYIRWDENLFQSFYKFQIICLSVTQLILGMHDISIWVFLFVFTDISVYVSSDERHICYIYILNKGCIIFVHIRWDGWDEN